MRVDGVRDSPQEPSATGVFDRRLGISNIVLRHARLTDLPACGIVPRNVTLWHRYQGGKMTKCRQLLAMSAVGLLLLAVVVAPGIPARAATPTFYTDRATFEAALPAVITDGYASPPYPAGFGIYDDAPFSAFFDETDYRTTGFLNRNMFQGNGNYCAGCNGSFELSFQTTSLTNGGTGVNGVGLDVVRNDELPQGSGYGYWAFITFGDEATEDIHLPAGASFFGVTAPELIVSIHFGLEKGGSTQDGYFEIDNLTIGGEYTNYVPLVLRGAAG